ncbi:Vanillate O-demethylase oxidoreductase [Thioclava dalianensis]|uniref:Vanillate O-demethylase oxidoreductase n=1 Tax=Thioclava dalianensis TaxID=1185766 RepID=A0A074TLS9_9RHOB|nr:PDR/VanB family oxidoreductase [Thioclava dalianensis]KEP71125.1 Vanillate O-demethylase oxidoreductase [Thioclava dalianensis]SFN24391.1 vanillate O-demethylase ferredoxin subunit [Thioclava dalianensis]
MAQQEQQKFRVSARRDDRGDIARIRLVPQVGGAVAPFTAGAHLDLYLPDLDLWRQYSLCSDPAQTDYYEIGVLKDKASRGGSIKVHEMAVEGAELTVEGPRNHFPLAEDAEETVLLGGGIGITPMLAMACRLHDLGLPFTLHYCTRSESVTAFRDLLETAPWKDRVVFHFDDGDAAQRLDPARDLPPPGKGTHLYVCGPQGFMDWLIGTAEAAGHASSNVHREYFSADVDASGESFEVVAERSGVTVTVGPDDTIAKALGRAGVKVEVKCEEGVCGTCVTDVLDGEIDHRDRFLTDEEREEGEMICACCSRAKSKSLTLDI